MIFAMRDHEKARDAASNALIALRTAMGKTQQSFAVEDLKTAIGTIGRYETSHPPRGDVLLRLAEIADGQYRAAKTPEAQLEFIRIRDIFRGCYLDDVHENIKGDLVMFPKTKNRRVCGYLFTSLEGTDALRAAQHFLDVLSAIRSKDSEVRQKAIDGVKCLSRKLNGNPDIERIREGLLAAISAERKAD
jgi:transcriptional regulator with XRE-family HTH domain